MPRANASSQDWAAPVLPGRGTPPSAQETNEWLAFSNDALLSDEGKRRLAILRKHFDNRSGLLPPVGIPDYSGGYSEKRLRLIDFARWASAMQWRVPGELDLAPAPASAPAPTDSQRPAGAKRWTPERLQELSDYRNAHGTKKAAEWFRLSESRVRQLLPSETPPPKGYSAFNPKAS